MATVPEPIRELSGIDPRALPGELLQAHQPVVLRGLVGDWPAVREAKASPGAAVAYLRRFRREQAPPVVATIGGPETGGRVFYNADMSGFNFERRQLPLDAVLGMLLDHADDPAPPMIYVASTTLETWLPVLRENAVVTMHPLASIWIGNRTRRCAPDLPVNPACVVAGRRGHAVPPDQLANLYIGPLDSRRRASR